MPRVWCDYLALLSSQTWLVTRTRRTFDRALQALPITQHRLVWPAYAKFAEGLCFEKGKPGARFMGTDGMLAKKKSKKRAKKKDGVDGEARPRPTRRRFGSTPSSPDGTETALRVFRRMVMVDPGRREGEGINYSESLQRARVWACVWACDGE